MSNSGKGEFLKALFIEYISNINHLLTVLESEQHSGADKLMYLNQLEVLDKQLADILSEEIAADPQDKITAMIARTEPEHHQALTELWQQLATALKTCRDKNNDDGAKILPHLRSMQYTWNVVLHGNANGELKSSKKPTNKTTV